MHEIYEIRDETDSDRYYPLGLFLTLEKAKQEILSTPSNKRISDINDDHKTICIYERKIGWGDSAKLVFKVTREMDMESDDDVWVATIEVG